MAVPFIPLPSEAFPEAARPSIERLNVFLLELSRLEGTIRQPIQSRRSDASVARRDTFQVDVSRITPSISEVVSGSSTVVGTPALTLGTANTVGSTTTAVSINSTIAAFDDSQLPLGLSMTAVAGTSAFAARADHRHQIGDMLRSAVNGTTLGFYDNGTDSFIANSLGFLQINPASEFQVNGAPHDNGGFTFNPSGVSTPFTFGSIRGRATAGTRTCLAPNWFSPASGDTFSDQTFRCWDAQFTTFAGQHTRDTWVGYDNSTIVLSPSTGSSGGNNAYCFRNLTFSIGNANGSWNEIASAYFKGIRRVLGTPTIITQATMIVEPPTAGTTDQVGILVRQQSAQATAPNRYGIKIDAQNSGTNRWCIYGTSDRAQFTGPLTVDGALGVTGLATFGNSVSVASGNVITGGLQCDTILNDTGLAGGTYSPTVSNEANAGASTTATVAQYMRVGNMVMVSGRFTADPLLTATATSFELSLPVASNFGAQEDAAGTAFCGAIAGQGAAIRGSTANDTAVVEWVSSDVTSQTWSYAYGYRVV